MREVLERLNPSAETLDASEPDFEPDRLLDSRAGEDALGCMFRTARGVGPSSDANYLQELNRHGADVASLSLTLEEPLDWTAFGIWLSMLLNRYGDDVLRVKGIVAIQGAATPVFINAVQHIVHPPRHLERWPSDDRRSRLVFITRGIDHALLRRSLVAFSKASVSDPTYA